MAIDIHQFICREDNFGLFVRDAHSGAVACIDAPDGPALAAEAKRIGWPLTHLLFTHHHYDHVEGADDLRAAFPGLVVIGAAKDAHRLPRLDRSVAEGDEVELGETRLKVLETPGHTLGHICYWCEDDEAVFVGDTLFSLGCGRVFEGDMETMHYSLERLAELPPETRIYCGHEYTRANARFALSVDPDNALLVDRAKNVDALLAAGKATLPTTVALECATNPFLRSEDVGIRRGLGLENADDVAVFTRLREMKNLFR